MGQRVVGLGKVAWRKTSEESFSPAQVEQERAFYRRSALTAPLLSRWRVDMHQASSMCEDRQDEVKASDARNVSLDRVDDPWPS